MWRLRRSTRDNSQKDCWVEVRPAGHHGSEEYRDTAGAGASSGFLAAQGLAGPTGVGKTWLPCALGQHACRQGFPLQYLRVPRVTETLRIVHANGSFGLVLAQLSRVDVLILDDWGMTPLDQATRHDLLKVIDDRSTSKSTLMTSRLPIENWHAWLNDTPSPMPFLTASCTAPNESHSRVNPCAEKHGKVTNPTLHRDR
jgi:hypothetical protein